MIVHLSREVVESLDIVLAGILSRNPRRRIAFSSACRP